MLTNLSSISHHYLLFVRGVPALFGVFPDEQQEEIHNSTETHHYCIN